MGSERSVSDTVNDWLALIEAAKKKHGKPSPWPACRARLRGERAGQLCKAAGCGVGGRCILHGGLPSSRPKGCAGPRRFVLFSNLFESFASRRWSWWAVPVDIFERLPLTTQHYPDVEGMIDEIAGAMRERGSHIGRYGEGVFWPQELGFSIVKRLALRGRVAFVVFSGADRKAVLRAQREHLPEVDRRRLPPTQRVDGEAFAMAMAQAGQRLSQPATEQSRNGMS